MRPQERDQILWMKILTLESACFLHVDFFKFLYPLHSEQGTYSRASYSKLMRRWGKNMQNILPKLLQKFQ